jgi:RNA polymerase sigma factor (sigma-70 family)
VNNSNQPPHRRYWSTQDIAELAELHGRRGRIVAYLRTEVRHVDHENVVSDAFLELMRNWDSIEKSKFAWLTTVARRKAIDIARKREASPRDILDGDHVRSQPLAAPDDHLYFRDYVDFLKFLDTASKLPQHLSQALVADLLGWTPEEHARKTGVSLATARSYISRARTALSGELAEIEKGNPCPAPPSSAPSPKGNL